MPAFHDLVVERLDRITADATVITLGVPESLKEAYRFRPGQHLAFRQILNGTDVRRSFSICTTPSSRRLQVAVKLLPNGVFSRFVHTELKQGDTLSVMTPAGRFGPRTGGTVVSGCGRSYVAIAAGSGITPVMSIMTAILEEQPDAIFTLIYGNRTSSSVMFADEIADLKDRFMARFNVIHVLSREQHESPVLNGRIDREKLETLFRMVPPPLVHEWFLCGPSGLVRTASDTLARAGVDQSRLHSELFFLSDEVPALHASPTSDGRSQVSARLDGRTTTFTMPDRGSLLDAVLAHRPDAPFSCKGGVCGTCRVLVTEGELEMARNYALDQQDLDDNFRLACQSVPRSPTVFVDFDAT